MESVTESDRDSGSEIVSVALSREYVRQISRERHKDLLDSLEPALCKALDKSVDAYQVVATMAADVLREDAADQQNRQSVIAAIPALRAAVPVERALFGARLIFRALIHADTPNFEGEQFLFNTGLAALKGVVEMESEGAR